jgi:hypothetical protein
MKVGTIKKIANEQLSPLAWQRVLLRILPDLNSAGYFLHEINDELNFDEKMTEKVRRIFLDVYDLDILNA